MEHPLDKWHFQKMEQEPEVVCNCDWCNKELFDESDVQIGHFVESANIGNFCPDCFYSLKKEGVIESTWKRKNG